MNPPPPLPYAPTRKTPLSPWNPLDYLQLLYWVSYFPQAIRWYVETFGNLPIHTNGRETFRNDPIQRKLAIQGLLLIITVPLLLAAAIRWFGIHIDTFGIAVGIAGGIAGGIVFSSAGGIAVGIAGGIAFGIAGGSAFGIAGGSAFGIAGGIAGGSAVGFALGSAGGSAGDSARGIAFGIAGGIAFGIAGGSAFGIAFGIAFTRLDVALFSLPLALFQPSLSLAVSLQRSSPLPLPRLRQRLCQRLAKNWESGISECEGLLRYSLQSTVVDRAIRRTLEETSPNLLLGKITSWCSTTLYDWRVVALKAMRHTYWGNVRAALVQPNDHPRMKYLGRKFVLFYDSPIRAACAGFWHLHTQEPDKARDAFAVVRQLPHGDELYNNANAFAAAFACENLEQIGNWQQPVLKVDVRELLRPQVHAAFAQLANIAQEIALVQHSRSTRQRNSALNRASGLLNALPTQLADCPTPERDLFVKISEQWLKIVLDSASAVGTLEVREVVASPYIVGAPLPANRLTGRQDVFDQINAMWAKPGQRDSLVIFGHRRMGKSSIVRNIQHFCKLDENTHLAVLNLQSVDFSHGLSDLCYALALRLWEAGTALFDEPNFKDYQEHPIQAFRRLLAKLNRHEPQPRCILILDEYELIDQKLSATEAKDFITMLRGLTQQYPWLVMTLVGLHSLEERSASFYEAIYAWRPIRVGLMDADAVAEVLQVEDDAFPLEYSPEAVERAHALTGGQPFLVQLLGDSLVQRFNQQLRHQLNLPSPTFSVADVDAVVADPQFYQQGGIYFRGIWSQANENPSGQQAILQALAPYENGLDQTALERACGFKPAVFNAALAALSRHDVVAIADRKCRYAVELMRRWVVSQ